MAVKLKEYFPILKERETLLSEIQSKPDLKKLFEEWTEEQQKEFLDFCTGEIGGVSVISFGESSEDSRDPSQRFHSNCR